MKNTYSWFNPSIEVKEVAKYGKGVFAKKNIKKGELLTIWGGYVMNIKEEKFLTKTIRDNAIQISDDLVFGIKKENKLENSS